ncbi:ribonuclease 3 drosha isoform X1 [Anticarsia gemmatalis]|uniref:ribonuclease 3 drosha isoform X1 n=1 Tax=Anticarsia gemmatalis TaxID=129554 RepID=UPI003F75BD03
MSVPPVDYSVPPPRWDVPPPNAMSTDFPPPQLYCVPPPYSVPGLPSTDQPPPYVPMATYPPLNLPPPSIPPPSMSVAPVSQYPVDFHSVLPPPPPPPPAQSTLPLTARPPPVQDCANMSYGAPPYENGKDFTGPFLVPPPKLNQKEDKPYRYGSTSSSSRSRYSPYRESSRDRRESSRDRRESSRERERNRSRRRSISPRRDYRSPSRISYKDMDKFYKDCVDEERDRRDRRESRRYEYERRPSPPRHRSNSRYSRRSRERDHERNGRSSEFRRPSELRRSSERRRSSESGKNSDSGRHTDYTRTLRSPSVSTTCLRESRSRTREPSQFSRHRSAEPMTDREKILAEYRKNYCKTSDDFIEKVQQWTRDHSDEDEGAKYWYRSSPAELYYTPVENGAGLQQTNKLEKICDTFFEKLIERGRKARPEVDELPPLKGPKGKLCTHNSDEETSSSSSESEDEACMDEDGLQGYTDRIMLELQRKQSHPRRLHPEMWFNNSGEMNGGPLCRCSARARRQGMRHGVYAGEGTYPRCIPTQNNIDKLYHYRITVSPPTNFLIKAPTIIAHDEHEFLFSGFSMFSHYKLAKLPTCKVIRFNIEYTILYVEEPAPQNFSVRELDLFEEFIFYELLELIDLDLGKATETSCSQFHFMPRFVRYLPEGGCEVLSMCEVLKYLIAESGLLIAPDKLEEIHAMDHYTWQKFVDRIKGMIVTYPGKKPCSVRVDQIDRSPPNDYDESKNPEAYKMYYPEIVHFGIRPPQLSYAGNPEYQKAWRYYVKYRHLIANMAKPSFKERQKLASKEATLQEMRTQSKMKRDVTVAISSEGFHTTGLMCDIVQHAMLIPVLVRHLRFHKSLDSLEEKMGYVFQQRALLQTALTHPSYRENFGTNPDHARNSLTNCGIRQPEYGDRRIHYTRKKGIVTLINIMSRFGKRSETESEIKHNERLEFLGDAVVEFLSSIHLFRMFPGLAEGGLATYRASIVQNQHLAQLAKNIGLEQYMLYAHGSDLCREVVMRHAMANCFEALMGALFLDAGLEVSVADRVFALALWHNEPDMLEAWTKERAHPLQEQEPLGDRQYIPDFEFLQKLTAFEDSIGIQFKHIRLLARAFTDRSVGFTHLTLGSNQRLEFLGDTVLQLVVSDRLYRHFPDHHEGHLSLLRSSLVNNRTQSLVCDDLNMAEYATYNNPKAKPTTKKHKADLLEAFLGALFIDKNLEYCQAFCNACLFPRLQEFIMNQGWNDPKSKLQQCCLTLRSMEGGEPDIPVYKVIECLGPTNTRVYTVGVYFRGQRLAAARGHSIQEAEMNAAELALNSAHELFPQLDHQKRVIAKSMRKKKNKKGESSTQHRPSTLKRKANEDKVPKAYKLNEIQSDSSDESVVNIPSDNENMLSPAEEIDEDSGLDSDGGSGSLDHVQVSSLLSDMQKLKDEMIRRNEYEKLKEKCKRLASDDD